MGKDDEGLKESTQIREYIKSQFGLIPESIMKSTWSVKTTRAGNKTGYDVRKDAKWWGTRFSISDASKMHQGDFPHSLCRFFIQYLCPEKSDNSYFNNGLASVFDPFSGHNSRAEDVFLMGRNYVGYDICHEYMDHNRRIANELKTGKILDIIPDIELNECDSRLIDTEKYAEKFDLSITSPPFWKAEKYGPETGQLFNLKTFDQFMFTLGNIFGSCYKVLKSNSYMVVECNDIRIDTIFYPFHAEVIKQLQLHGFQMHDIVICDLGNSFQQIFCSELLRTRTVAKRHSYFIVVQKRDTKSPVYIGEERKELVEKSKYIYVENSEDNQVKLF